ncbi:hypothetical protein A9Z42_0051180 [Trichoderma parareesei]|uniref:Uncharacterized protein n=1 Tax=Trichoderma parareesei TaxID=858221 RepID=A0A2H2ZF87_TRIPA|nr:hypothetical protein A9Z42_0051180 [Trichoderma parareesei]
MGYKECEAQREQAMQQYYMAMGAHMILQQQAQQEPQEVAAQKHQWMSLGGEMAMHKLQQDLHGSGEAFEQQ